mgnify:CR=1 FL=1
MLKDADVGHFTFHALRHTFATRALERGMDYKTLSAILGHYSVAFTMGTYVHSMDEHKRNEMNKMDDMFGVQYSISVENNLIRFFVQSQRTAVLRTSRISPESQFTLPHWTLPC